VVKTEIFKYPYSLDCIGMMKKKKIYQKSTHLSNQFPITPTHLDSRITNEFSYKKSELEKFNKKDLLSLIVGCTNSYGSKELMSHFTKSEYLGKLAALPTLKFDKTFLNKLYHYLTTENIETKIDVHTGFECAIKYLDNIAYAHNSWKTKTSHIKNNFSTAKGEQHKRINQIPEEEKRSFLKSLFYTPNITIDDLTSPTSINFMYQLNSDNKTMYINALNSLLEKKWNNKDPVPIVRQYEE
jgi:hypothetical protein